MESPIPENLMNKGSDVNHEEITMKEDDMKADNSKSLRESILNLVKEYYESEHKNTKPFVSGDRIPYGGRFYDEKEMQILVEASLDFWLTTGRFSEKFEKELSDFLGIKYCSLVNSGSSANLLAFMSLTSEKLGERRISRGDEIITVASCFPTTIAPIIQYGAVPVFVDVAIPDYNIDTAMLEKAISEKTKAVFIAHTLGNPFDVNAVRVFCDKYDLWLIEDNCDALGSKFNINDEWKYTGTFGDVATSSFYPPHHITMGEGGAVYTENRQLKLIVDSFRDWGRDCWCPSGKDNTCKKRFNQKFGELPQGYDHKYVYSHFGYNLKVTDMQAAIGCAQLKKLPGFIENRRKNWNLLKDGLSDLEGRLVMPQPMKNSMPSWFGYIMTVRDDAGFTRDDIVNYLESKNIQTRMLFSGNIIKHPCFDEMRRTGKGYRVVGELKNTDRIMNNSFWIGVFPGLTGDMIDYMISSVREFVLSRLSA